MKFRSAQAWYDIGIAFGVLLLVGLISFGVWAGMAAMMGWNSGASGSGPGWILPGGLMWLLTLTGFFLIVWGLTEGIGPTNAGDQQPDQTAEAQGGQAAVTEKEETRHA